VEFAAASSVHMLRGDSRPVSSPNIDQVLPPSNKGDSRAHALASPPTKTNNYRRRTQSLPNIISDIASDDQPVGSGFCLSTKQHTPAMHAGVQKKKRKEPCHSVSQLENIALPDPREAVKDDECYMDGGLLRGGMSGSNTFMPLNGGNVSDSYSDDLVRDGFNAPVLSGTQ
jgi:hypothetical protein